MKCERCGEPATVHLTHIESGGQKKEIHLCRKCAEQGQVIKKQELNLPAILQSLIGHNLGALSDELSKLACPACGIKYMEFRHEGRLGCPHDYIVFRKGLEPLLDRIHRAMRHVGKRPRQGTTNNETQREVLELRRQLAEAVQQEAFEQAAQLRDSIREKERQR